MNKRVTLKEIALTAGVSRGVAGKVLNGCHGDIRVGAEARARILAVAREMNYHPNMAAAMLAGRKSHLIGVLVDSQALFRNQQLLRVIEQAAFEKGHRILVSFTHDNVGNMRENLSVMRRYGVCGVICIAHQYPGLLEETRELFQEAEDVVFFEEPLFPHRCCVKSDYLQALTDCFAGLKRVGKKRIAITHGNPVYTSEALLAEYYRKALEANDLQYEPALCGQYPDGCTAKEACDYIVEHLIQVQRPDALFVDDATYALCIQGRLQYDGWKIPEEIVLLGGNNDRLFQHATPPIESLNPHYDKIAEALVLAVINEFPCGEQVIETTCPLPVATER